MSILGERLKKVREAYGLTIDDAVKLLGVSRSSIVFYESGTQTPPLEKLCKIADVYMVSVDYLLGRVDYDIDIYQANMERVRREAYECICMRNKKVDYEPEKDQYPNRLAGNKPYPYNLLDVVFEDIDDKRKDLIEWLTEEQEEYLNEALNKLTNRERAAIKYIFEQRMTLDDVAKIFDLTRERIRQIMHKAVQKLRHPCRSYPILYGSTKPRVGIYHERIEELGAEIEYLTEQRDDLKQEKDDLKQELNALEEEKKLSDPILSIPVFELNLSVRTTNALNRAGCKTVGDVVSRIENGTIYDIRNFGVRCADELAIKLATHGIVFARVAKRKGA